MTSIENSSSHIYHLKTKFQHSLDDFVEGADMWEKRKAHLIIEMAASLEKLHFLGEYPDTLNTISSYIRKRLAERGVSDDNLDYVGKVLPSKYKNQDMVREHQNCRNIPANINNINNNNENDQIRLVDISSLKRKLENFSETELQNYAMEIEQKHKHIRTNMKEEKNVVLYEAIKHNYRLPRYKKVSYEKTPEHLHGASLLEFRVKKLSQSFFDIHKHLEDIATLIHQIPPDDEISERNAKRLDIFDRGVLKTIKTIFLRPISDKKWSADWIKWIDIHFTRLEQSKNYAGSKHALETGEYAVRYKDGTEQFFKLDRGITREQVGDKEPELFAMVQQMLISNPMLQAFHDWSYNTYIEEEYDQDGNPIISSSNKKAETSIQQ